MLEINHSAYKGVRLSTIFLKLGGSLITDKNTPFTARHDIIRDIGNQIKDAIARNPDVRLLIGHGSGSFGHAAAKAVGYKEGNLENYNPVDFESIQIAARQLNNILVDELIKIPLPVISFPPSSYIQSKGKEILNWDVGPIRTALESRMLPIIFGDAVIDSELGGVIFSTEELFLYLIDKLQPEKTLIAGKEKGVWADYPNNQRLIPVLTSENFSRFESSIHSSHSVDVTGGMLKKVQLLFKALEIKPDLEINIFSGEQYLAIFDSISGKSIGTVISK